MQNPLLNDPDPARGWKLNPTYRHQPTWRAKACKCTVFPYKGVYVGMPQIYCPTDQALPKRNNTVGLQEI